MSTQASERTPDRMTRFEAFLQTLADEGLNTPAPPFSLPIERLAAATTLDEKWNIADAWLNDVTYVGSPYDPIRGGEPFPQISAIKQRVAAWRQQEKI